MFVKALGSLVSKTVETVVQIPEKIFEEFEEVPHAIENVFDGVERGLDSKKDKR